MSERGERDILGALIMLGAILLAFFWLTTALLKEIRDRLPAHQLRVEAPK